MTRKLLGLCLALSCQGALASGLTTHLNMSKSAQAHMTSPPLKQLVEQYERFVLTGTVYPDFDGSIAVLPNREARGAFGMFHRGEIHRAYLDHLRGKYDVATCLQRNDEPCLQSVALFLGVVGHSIQDNSWDMLFVRKGFIRDYHTDDLWVGDLDTGGDVALWADGRHFEFSYSAPYGDLLDLYHNKLPGDFSWIDEDYIGDGVRTHNIALRAEDQLFWVQNADDDYRGHAPWFMDNIFTDEMGLPLYEEITGKAMEAAWQALTNANGYRDVEPVMMTWPRAGTALETDAYPVVIFNVPVINLNKQSIYITDAQGNVIDADVRSGDGYGAMLQPTALLAANSQYRIHVTSGVTHTDGQPVTAQTLVYDFETGGGQSQDQFWRDGVRYTTFNPGRPWEETNGPDYFAFRDQQSGRCVAIKDGLVFNGNELVMENCNNSDAQQWYVRTHEPAGHTRGLKFVSKANDAFCFDLGNGHYQNGGVVQLWHCDNHDNKRWIDKFDQSIRTTYDRNQAIQVVGDRLRMQAFSGAASQKFTKVYEDKARQFFQLRDRANGQCLAAASDDIQNKTDVKMVGCNSADHKQWWAWDGEDRLHNRAAWFKCLDAFGGNAQNGTQLVLWDCKNDASNQKWQEDGYSIRSRLNQTFTIDASDGVKLYQYSFVDWHNFDQVYADGTTKGPVHGDRVCFYENNHYQGRQLCLGEGQYDFANSNWNDIISGMQFHGNVYVEVFEHDDFQGTRFKVINNVAYMGAFKDRISSISIKRRPHNNYACVYEDPNYQGTAVCSFTGEQVPFTGDMHMNDKISSVSVSGNARITLYDDRDYGGGSASYSSSQSSISFNDRASAYRVQTP